MTGRRFPRHRSAVASPRESSTERLRTPRAPRVAWFEWSLGGRTDDGMAFFEFAGGRITRVTDFWPEPYEPPPGREHLVERWLPSRRAASGPLVPWAWCYVSGVR
jgi:hypothetical protein